MESTLKKQSQEKGRGRTWVPDEAGPNGNHTTPMLVQVRCSPLENLQQDPSVW